MALFEHLLLFLLSAGIIWFFAGLLIESINSVAKRFNQSGFTMAFFVLGFLTSISEISVMVNSSINGTPQVSAGNLVGASIVILLFIVPLLAIVGNGIRLNNTLHHKNLAIALFAAGLPALLLLDGSLNVREGVICLMLYITLLYGIRKQHETMPKIIEAVEGSLVAKSQASAMDAAKITIGALFIFGAGHILVKEAVFFANILSVPSSIIGLLVLSIGTNIPELVIAVRSIIKKHTEIAFGDYLGSAVTNTVIFGFLPVLNGSFTVESSEFVITAVLTTIGFTGFYIASKSRNKISKQEGYWLLSVYGLFLLIQLINFLRFAQD